MYPFPVFERERISALHAMEILDSKPAPDFDNVIQLARDLFTVPICLISVVGDDRQWFKAKCGLDVEGTDREVAFCNYTILSSEVLIVEDATRDPRFARNPLVTGHPNIRFYAGAPLVLGPGIALGSLCLIDTKPRRLTEADTQTLERLATLVTSLIRGHGLAAQSVRMAQDVENHRSLVEKQARELEIRERRFGQTERMAGIGGWELTLGTSDVEWSDETYRICGVPIGTPVNLELAVSVYPEPERVRLHALIERALRDGTGYDDEFEIVTPQGIHRWVRAIGDIEHRAGEPHRLFGTIQDVSERHRIEARLWNSANYDALTGLANRNRFNEILPEAFAGAGPPGLLMIDTDRLKDINDTLGHAAGDALLREIGSRLRHVVGAAGTVARLSGDEFAVLMGAPASPETLQDLANGIITAMQAPMVFQGSTLKPQVSIGGAISVDKNGIETLRQEADLALYHAKETRRGAYVFFRSDLKSAIMARIAAVNVIDDALHRGEVFAWYQPVVDLASGRVSGLEALARVRRGESVHSIGDFAHALQDPRTASRLTSRMLERIEADILAWRSKGIEMPRIALNAGSADFQDDALEAMILQTCVRAGIAPTQFALEVTESVFLSRDADTVSRAAGRLRAHGVIIALDDFGTGYASLAHLGTFPVDVIKIDRSFVAQITETGPRSMISSALIDLAKRLNIKVIAEGVETNAQLERLVRLGCDKVQGYLLSRPLPPADVAEFLTRFNASRREFMRICA